MTKNELKGHLTALGVTFRAKATLPELQALFDKQTAPVAQHIADFNEVHEEKLVVAPVDEFTSDDQQVGFNPIVDGPFEGSLIGVETAEDTCFSIPAGPMEQWTGEQLQELATDLDIEGAEHIEDIAALHSAILLALPYDVCTCPHCGIDASNGFCDFESLPNDPTGNNHPDIHSEYMCLGCGGQWGPAVVRKQGLKIEKDREERNGIKRPSVGGKCRAVWDALDALAATKGDTPTAKEVKAMAEDKGWNPNNASIEYYQWRKFMGITGRTPKA